MMVIRQEKGVNHIQLNKHDKKDVYASFFVAKNERRMETMIPGVSTLGVELGWSLETTAGTKPTKFKRLTRINSIGGIELETEQIDASALED